VSLLIRGGALCASSVLARRDGEIAVIDTGLTHHAASLVAALRREGLTPQDITLVFNTHAHVDHSHNNSLFPGARIYCSRLDRAWTRALHASLVAVDNPGAEHVQPFYPARSSSEYEAKVMRKFLALDKLLWDESRWREDDRTFWLEETELPAGISLIRTPGHAPHHVSFAVETEGRPVLVCGDAVIHRDDLEAPAPRMPLWDASAWYASLDRIRAFDGIIVPGHDEPFDNVPVRK